MDDRWLDGSLAKLSEIVKDSKAWHAEVHGAAESWTGLNNLLELDRTLQLNNIKGFL